MKAIINRTSLKESLMRFPRRVAIVLCLEMAFLGIVAGANTSLLAAEFDPAKLAQIKNRMQEFVDQKLIAGAVTAVGSKEGLASLDAVGYLKLETKQPMPKDALFRIASMTKPITSIGIMILQEEGKLAV